MHDCNKTLDAGLIFHLHHRMGEKWHLTISRVIPPENWSTSLSLLFCYLGETSWQECPERPVTRTVTSYIPCCSSTWKNCWAEGLVLELKNSSIQIKTNTFCDALLKGEGLLLIAVDVLFSNSLIIYKENTKEILFNECLEIRWKTAHFCILNFSC